MNPVPHDLLPLATTSAFTDWTRASTHVGAQWSQAWSRARHAQPEAQPTKTPPPAALPPRHSAPEQALRSFAGHAAGADARTQCRPAAATEPPQVHLAQLPACATSGDSERLARDAQPGDVEPASIARSQPRACLPPSSAHPSRIHVHVEHHPDGLAVWLGIPAPAGGAAVRSLLAALRHPSPGGMPLARLTCNGRTVHDTHSHPQETS